MAKKASKKSAKKATAKASAKGGKKAAGKPVAKTAKKAARTPAAKAAKRVTASAPAAPAQNPEVLSTGSGASALDIGQSLVSMFNEGKFKEIEEAYWSKDVVSIEGFGVNMAWHGRAKVEEKNAGWMADHVIHGASAQGPYVGATGFAVKFQMDVETKSSGQRQVMEEVGVYDVRDGKIVREEFMYFIPR
jgi:hypothetical protein